MVQKMMVVLVIMFVRYVSYVILNSHKSKCRILFFLCISYSFFVLLSSSQYCTLHIYLYNRIVDMSLQKVLPLGRRYQITIVVLHVVHPNVDLRKYPRVVRTKQKSLLLLVKKMNHRKRNRGFRRRNNNP